MYGFSHFEKEKKESYLLWIIFYRILHSCILFLHLLFTMLSSERVKRWGKYSPASLKLFYITKSKSVSKFFTEKWIKLFSLGFTYKKKNYVTTTTAENEWDGKRDRHRLMRQIIWVLHLWSRFLRAVILSHRIDEQQHRSYSDYYYCYDYWRQEIRW